MLLFAYPYILGRNVSDINGSLPFFDKIVLNTNLIPFNFNYDINLDIIVKNIALKLLLFVPFVMIMKKEVTFKQGICALLLIRYGKENLLLVHFHVFFVIMNLYWKVLTLIENVRNTDYENKDICNSLWNPLYQKIWAAHFDN